MGENPGPNAVATGLVPLQSPFAGTVILYTDTTQPNTLWYTIPGSPKGATWQKIIADNTAFSTTTADPKSTLNYVYNSRASTVGVFYNTNTNGEKIHPTDVTLSTVNLNTVTGLPSTIQTASKQTSQPVTSGSITSGPSATLGSSPSASSTSSRTPTPTLTTTPSPSHGLSSGAIAGIVIGCLIAGALVAGLLWWFCFKRRKPASTRDSEASALALMQHEKGTATKALSLESGSPLTAAMENGLPQPLEDRAISGEISKISNLVKNHVQSYYHSDRVNTISIDYDDIQALGSDLPISVGTLSTLLSNAATREIGLRFCIAWVIVSRMQLKSSPSSTFLPPEVAQQFQGMSYADRGPEAHATFFPKWQAITVELLESTYIRSPFSADDPRLSNIQEAADILDNILRPYSDSRMDNGQRSRNLEEILKRSAQFAFTLFSQPTSWDYDWQSEKSVKSGSLCIFPALVQVADERGEPVKPPRPFSEAVVRRLDD